MPRGCAQPYSVENHNELIRNIYKIILTPSYQEREKVRSDFDYLFRNGSLVDHMLNMMEKYTTNLEDIVADRTRQLEEEKNKTETLLYKMLPK